MSDMDRELKNSIFEAARAAQSAQQGLQEVSAADVVKQEFGIEIPVAEVPLPSLGKVYSANSVLANKETLPIRAMTAKEEDIIMNDYFNKKGMVISELIKSVCQLRGFDPMEMTIGDRNAIMVGIRIVGHGADYRAQKSCAACNTLQDVVVDLNSLEIQSLTVDPMEPNTNLFEFQLPVTKKTVTYRLLTGKDEREMLEEMEIKKKKGLQNSDLITSNLFRQLVSVDGVTDRNMIRKFVNAMPVGDSKALRNYINKNQPDIKTTFFFECSNCGHVEKESPMPYGASFFWPDE